MPTATCLPEPPPLELIDAELCGRRLKDFLLQVWPVLEPGTPFVDNWHIGAVCEYLEAAAYREVRKLVINIPPRTLKSTLVSVGWQPWVWLLEPETRWLFSSYAAVLSTRDSVRCRRIIQHPGTRPEERFERDGRERTLLERFGYRGLLRLLNEDWALMGDQNLKTRFDNDRTGYRLATSVDGSATGEGGDFIVADDPHKVGEAESELVRTGVCQWWDETMSTRLNDPKTGVRVIVMQRVHEQDLTGHLLAKARQGEDTVEELRDLGWTHLCLPNEHEPQHPFVWPDDPRIEKGALLFPNRIGEAETAQLKVDLGSQAYAGQFQQRPSPAEGNRLKRRWLRYFDPDYLTHPQDLASGNLMRVEQSWDLAGSLTAKETQDFVVGQVWAWHLSSRFLLREVRGRWGLAETKLQIQQLTAWVQANLARFAVHVILVENRALGPEVIADLSATIPGIVPVDPSKDKGLRLEAVTPQFEAGNVHVPGFPTADGADCDPARTPLWVQETVNEWVTFPNAPNDDRVDAMTQALDPQRALLAQARALPTKAPAAKGGVQSSYSTSEFG